MAAYLTFLLDLAAEGENRIVEGTVAFRPDPAQRPNTAFVWKIVCDANGFVIVRGLLDGKLQAIATARWTGTLRDREQRSTTPTDFQWDLLQTALEHASALRKADPSPYDDSLVDSLAPDEARAFGAPRTGLPKGLRSQLRAQAEASKATRTRRYLGASIAVGAFALVLVGVLLQRLSRDAPRATPAPVATPAPPAPASTSSPPPPAPPPKVSTFADVIAANPNLRHVELAKHPLRWSEVDVPSQTTPAKVEKDPAAEKGKRVCVEGTLERITKLQVANRPHHTGALVTTEGDRVVFLVGGSTGELLKRDAVRACGVVTGTAGGDTELFGMFDLPDNRNPMVEKP